MVKAIVNNNYDNYCNINDNKINNKKLIKIKEDCVINL
jgi:hypothetical protein